MNFSTIPILISAFALLQTALASGQTRYSFRPFEPGLGEVMTMHTKSNSGTGTVTILENDIEVSEGRVTVNRERRLERRVVGAGASKQVRIDVLTDVTKTTTTVDGETKTESSSSSLTGKTLAGSCDASGHWRLSLPGATPSAAQAIELAQFEAYENHRLLPSRPVRLKESWEINPAFLKHLTERGIGPADANARARLEEIKVIDGEETAVITLTVETVATEGSSVLRRGAGATIKASGTLHVSMESMLDKKLILYGSITTVTVEGATRTRLHLPVQIEVTKQVGR